MISTEAVQFIESAISLTAMMESDPLLKQQRDIIATEILASLQVQGVPTEMIAVACLTIAVGIIQSNAPVKQEKPLVTIVQ